MHIIHKYLQTISSLNFDKFMKIFKLDNIILRSYPSINSLLDINKYKQKAGKII